MLPGQMISGKLSTLQFSPAQVVNINLPLNFGPNQISWTNVVWTTDHMICTQWWKQDDWHNCLWLDLFCYFPSLFSYSCGPCNWTSVQDATINLPWPKTNIILLSQGCRGQRVGWIWYWCFLWLSLATRLILYPLIINRKFHKDI